MRNLNLERAEYCLEVMKRDGIYRAQKIGKITESFETMGPPYKKDDFVIFIDEGDKTVTIETPCTKEEIIKNKKEKSLISTFGTIINVPRRFVEELNK